MRRTPICKRRNRSPLSSDGNVRSLRYTVRLVYSLLSSSIFESHTTESEISPITCLRLQITRPRLLSTYYVSQLSASSTGVLFQTDVRAAMADAHSSVPFPCPFPCTTRRRPEELSQPTLPRSLRVWRVHMLRGLLAARASFRPRRLVRSLLALGLHRRR